MRKQFKLSQTEMDERSGVSLGSLKLYKNTGKISPESLLKLSHLLSRLEDFENVFQPGEDPSNFVNLFTSKV